MLAANSNFSKTVSGPSRPLAAAVQEGHGAASVLQNPGRGIPPASARALHVAVAASELKCTTEEIFIFILGMS